MKTLDIKKYSEKLKIKPVNVNDLDEVNPAFRKINFLLKQRLSTFDIVKMHGSLYMVFIDNDFNRITGKKTLYKDIIYYKDYRNIQHMMSLSDNKYDDNLNYIGGLGEWNITDVWFHPQKFIFSGTDDKLTQDNLEKWLDDYRFIHQEKGPQ